MPHIVLEYSANVHVDVQPLFDRLHRDLAATGEVGLKGMKSRATCYQDWRLSDGNPEYAFAHLTITHKGGRTRASRESFADVAIEVLKDAFAEVIATRPLSLSVDVREMDPDVMRAHRTLPDAH